MTDRVAAGAEVFARNYRSREVTLFRSSHSERHTQSPHAPRTSDCYILDRRSNEEEQEADAGVPTTKAIEFSATESRIAY